MIQPISFTSQYKSTYKPSGGRKIKTPGAEFDETLKEINNHPSNPCAYYTKNYQHVIPRTQENLWALQDFYKGKLSHDGFLAQMSYNNICNDIASSFDATNDIAARGRQIENSFLIGDEDASTYEMVLESVKNKELTSNVFIGLEKKAWFKDEFLDDLNKYYDAKTTNKDIEKTFVPSFASKLDALDSTPRGGVFQLEDNDFIFIKTDDNEAKELFISPNTYLELFPPLQKNALCQGQVGDCFFIASMQTLYSNPKTRNLVLEMFKENPDGTLSVCLSGYKKEDEKVVPKTHGVYEIIDAQKTMKGYNKKRLAFQYEAMRLLEMCVDNTTKFNAYNNIVKQYNLYNELIGSLQNDEDSIELPDGMKYTKKEMQLFIDMVGDINDFDYLTKEIVSLEDAFINCNFKDYFFDEDALLDTSLAAIEDFDYTQEEEEYLTCVLNRYKQFFLENPDVKIKELKDFLPQNCFMAIKGEEKPYDYINYGGRPDKVYKRVGLDAKKLNEDEAKGFFMQPDLDSKYVMTGVSSVLHNKPFIMPAHAYSLRVDKVGGKDVLCAQNPYNGAQDILMSLEAAADIFDDIYVAKI